MARANATWQRLYVTADLSADAALPLDDKQAHYIRNVLRLNEGADLLLFNGRDGEWHGAIEQISKKQVIVRLVAQTRPQQSDGQMSPDICRDIWLMVAPVKKDRLDYLAQKATEMGVTKLAPVITRRTQNAKGGVKTDKLIANVIEAAEQCNLLSVPEVDEPRKLADVLADFSANEQVNEQAKRHIVFCDEEAAIGSGRDALPALKGQKLALLIGPEGGFDDEERAMLEARDDVTCVSLGPRILRTDTAVVAALALLQSQIGDW